MEVMLIQLIKLEEFLFFVIIAYNLYYKQHFILYLLMIIMTDHSKCHLIGNKPKPKLPSVSFANAPRERSTCLASQLIHVSEIFALIVLPL